MTPLLWITCTVLILQLSKDCMWCAFQSTGYRLPNVTLYEFAPPLLPVSATQREPPPPVCYTIDVGLEIKSSPPPMKATLTELSWNRVLRRKKTLCRCYDNKKTFNLCVEEVIEPSCSSKFNVSVHCGKHKKYVNMIQKSNFVNLVRNWEVAKTQANKQYRTNDTKTQMAIRT